MDLDPGIEYLLQIKRTNILISCRYTSIMEAVIY